MLTARLRTHLLAGSPATVAGKAFSALLFVDQLELLNNQVRAITHRIRELLAAHPLAPLFLNFPGMGDVTASILLAGNASTRTWRLDYRASTAQWHAERRTRRPKISKLAANERLREYVQDRLAGVIRAPDGRPVPGPVTRFSGRRHGPRQDRRWATCWSPEQIARRLPADFPDDESMRVSHEAIYQALYVQGRGALKRELAACLRTGRALRVPRARTRGRGKKFVTPEVMISQRPAEARTGPSLGTGKAT